MAADAVKGSAAAGSAAPSAAAAGAPTIQKVVGAAAVADVALAALGHRTTGQWLGQGSHRSFGTWVGQGNHRSVWEWLKGERSRNKP